MLAILESASLVLSKLAHLHDSVVYTIVGMMIVTFGYIFENMLPEKESFPYRRLIIVLAIFAIVVMTYWLSSFA
jgi:hypothetical protein